MKYPCLVLKSYCKTDIEVKLEQEGVSRYGEPLPTVCWTGKCNYQDTAKTVYTSDKKAVTLSGCAYIPGDIASGLPVISGGSIRVFGVTRRIFRGMKARNPDGSVNYTRLDVE